MIVRRVVAGCVALALIGCAHTPYVGKGPHPQVVRGRPFFPVDAIGNVLGLPGKILLWHWRVDNHAISERTEALLVEYLDAKQSPAFDDTIFRLNQYHPFGDLKALWKNRHVKWPYRLTLGLYTTLVYDVLLPGRLFGGDSYNPWTNVAHIYSDVPSVALHEAGHAYDASQRRFKGTYAAMRAIPGFKLHKEWQASRYAVRHLQEAGHQEEEIKAYTILTPAYGSYVGSYFVPPFGTLVGVATGHVLGRSEARQKRRQYAREAEAARSVVIAPGPVPTEEPALLPVESPVPAQSSDPKDDAPPSAAPLPETL